ncbi:MAG: DNA-binding protein, partial [Flavobacterium sp.]|nr:DNA-binding protein [Flavobacterium sp.]
MELVTLESKAYQMLLAKIAKIEEYIKADDAKPKPSKEQEEIWMDNYD